MITFDSLRLSHHSIPNASQSNCVIHLLRPLDHAPFFLEIKKIIIYVSKEDRVHHDLPTSICCPSHPRATSQKSSLWTSFHLQEAPSQSQCSCLRVPQSVLHMCEILILHPHNVIICSLSRVRLQLEYHLCKKLLS